MRTKLIAAAALAVSPILTGCATSETSGHREQVIPDQYHGEWDVNLAHCGSERKGNPLRIEAQRVYFYESSGPVSEVVEAGPNEVTVTVQLSGEGDTWSTDIRMELADGLDTLIIDGYARYRCK